MAERTLFDISPMISPRTAVFPGDQPFERRVALAFAKGDHLELSSFQTSAHIGAHADAPNHYHAQGEGIATRSLDPYLGRVQVVDVSAAKLFGKRVPVAALDGRSVTAPRVLFRTDTFQNPDRWPTRAEEAFASLSPELIDTLAARGVKLVGIDTPSIDPETSKSLESHQAVCRHDLCILEGLVLTAVPEGEYTLIALPLKLEALDASPVRAILVKGPLA